MCTQMLCVHICAKFELATANTVAWSRVYRPRLTSYHTTLTTTTMTITMTTWKYHYLNSAEISAELKMTHQLKR